MVKNITDASSAANRRNSILSFGKGNFQLGAKFKVPLTAITGPAAMNGKLRYQACNDKMCLAPKDLDVNVQIDIVR